MTHTQHTIAYRMARTIVLLTLCLGLIIGSLLVVWDYQQRLDNFNSQIASLLGSVEKAAVRAVYTFDTGLAVEVANGLFAFPPISSVTIRDENNTIMSTLERYNGPLPFATLSELLFKPKYAYTIDLHLQREPDRSIGSLYIEVVPHQTAEAFFKRALIILGLALVQSFLIAIFLFYVFHNRVTRPLQRLADDFTRIDPQAPSQSQLTLSPALKGTEFEDVTLSGTNMLNVIGSHLKEKEKAESELKRQKEENERFLQIAEAIILRLDNNGRVIKINQRGLDVMGCAADEIVGKNWFETAIPRENRANTLRIFNNLFFAQKEQLKNLTPSSYLENDIITKKGERRRIFWHNAREVNRDGETIGVLSSGQDITARKKAEDALKATEGSLRAIIEATSEGFAIIEIEKMELVDINSSLCQLLGYSREEMLFSPLSKFIYPDDMDILSDYFRHDNNRPHRTYELRLRRCDAKRVPVEINLSKLPYEKSAKARTVAFITDITKRREQEKRQKKLEQQLRQAQKMETIGTLAGGIAHDFNNILTPILGYASLLSARIDKDSPNHERITQIAKSAKRGADMIKQILSFSRRSESEMESRFLAPILEDTLQLIKATQPSNIEIALSISKNCPPVVVDHTQIQQMILNLCTNANQAMEKDGGTLRVSMEHCMLQAEIADTSPILEVGPHIKISISDTGHGMDEQTLTRIFDPFYTTKESGKGTGLGLAMVHAIVQDHKGDIFVKSILGEGSTFTIYLPVSDQPVAHMPMAEEIFEGNMECALIVDDELLNTNFLEELLEDVGYSFDSFNSALEALEAFKADPDKYQIILTDQTMPKMNGAQLIKAIHAIRPEIPVIMMSGYDQTVTMENAENFGIDFFITKPVSIDRLTKAMHDLLHKTA